MSKDSLVKFENVELHLAPDPQHDWLLSLEEVARGYGISVDTLRQHKRNHGDELCAGKHFITVQNLHSNPRGGKAHKKTMWTKRGIVRLGFFIKSPRAKKFRDFAEDLVLEKIATTTALAPVAKPVAVTQPILLAPYKPKGGFPRIVNHPYRAEIEKMLAQKATDPETISYETISRWTEKHPPTVSRSTLTAYHQVVKAKMAAPSPISTHTTTQQICLSTITHISSELEKRSLADVPTAQLLEWQQILLKKL